MDQTDIETIVGAVLAGGRAQRMGGGDKPLQELDGRPMLARIAATLAPQVGRLIISANGDPERFAAFGLPVVGDVHPGHSGPLAGVLAAMRWAAANVRQVRWIATVPGDAPFIPLDLVARLAAASCASADAIAVAQSAGVLHHATALWPMRLANALERAIDGGEYRVGHWAAGEGRVAVPFELVEAGGETIDPFFNVNTPGDLREAARLMDRLALSKDAQ